MALLTKLRALLADGAKASIRLGGTGAGFDQGSSFITARLSQGTRSTRDWRSEVGDLWASNIVLSCLKWQAKQFSKARLVVNRPDADGEMERVPDHPALPLMRRPCGYMTPRNVWAAVLLSLNCDGNAYLWKERNGAGAVIGLHYLPHWVIGPKGSGVVAAPVARYEYRPDGGAPVSLAVEEIIHIRDGVDPRNRLKGLSPLAAILKEIFTDDEAAVATATLLKNLGVPGAIFTPKMIPEGMNPDQLISPATADAIKRRYKEGVTGDSRGEAIVLTIPFDVTLPGFSPQQLLMDKLRDVPEERVTAALGIPAAIVGFGAGLAQTTNRATADALERWAWQHNILPTCELIDEHNTMQLLPDFIPYGGRPGDEFGRDVRGVEALKEQQKDLYERLTDAVGGPWLTPNEARHQAGYDALEGLDVTMVPGTEGQGAKSRWPFRGQAARGGSAGSVLYP